MPFRNVDDVVEAVRRAKDSGTTCAVLIGAGCSKSAGIPLAREFVNIIERKWPRDFARAEEKTYPHCMGQLAPAERRSLIAQYVDAAKINWAHLALAQLIKEGWVDRVLTTNFDPLVLRACALVGVFPAVYDFAASQQFKPAFTPKKAVFHLHGQHTGFVLLNTKREVAKLSRSVAPLFEDTARGRLWLVVGYSGENDPVFDHLAKLAKVNRLDNRLYWVGYKDSEPALHVRERLLGKDKAAYFVKGHDADSLFALLAQGLKCFPPKFVERPFSHLNEMLEVVTPYTLPGQAEPIDVRSVAKALIEQAIEQLEQGPERTTLLAQTHLLSGQIDQLLAMQSEHMSPELTKAVAWALTLKGNRLSDQARTKSATTPNIKIHREGKVIVNALSSTTASNVSPDTHESLNNWGNALSAQANTKSGAEADALFAQAAEKYEAALRIKSDIH